MSEAATIVEMNRIVNKRKKIKTRNGEDVVEDIGEDIIIEIAPNPEITDTKILQVANRVMRECESELHMNQGIENNWNYWQDRTRGKTDENYDREIMSRPFMFWNEYLENKIALGATRNPLWIAGLDEESEKILSKVIRKTINSSIKRNAKNIVRV